MCPHVFLIWESGGRQGKMPVTAFEAFDLEMKSWTRYPCIPSRRAFSSCAATERAFYSLGGLQQPGPHNFYSRPHFVSTVEEYDSEQGEYCSHPHIPYTCKHELWQRCGKKALKAVYGALLSLLLFVLCRAKAQTNNCAVWKMQAWDNAHHLKL